MPHTILSYSDKLFTPSESFIPRAYHAFETVKPLFIGHDRKGPTPPGFEALELGAFHGGLGETGFKQLGLVGRELRETLAHFNPVAIHANFGKSGAYALPLARALKIPLIVTYHGGDATKTSNTKDSRLRVYNRRRQALWDEAALLLPVSDFIRRELLAKGAPDEKMVVQYNGVDPEKFTPGEKENVLLFAGRWMEKKGIETLIRALTKIDPEILKNWRIRLLGDGELKPKLLPLLEAAGVKAELPGWIPADEMPRHFEEAAIACVPSNRAASGDAEGLPMVCMEAMFAGCALAATAHAGIPECVVDGETGYLVEERDADALADRLTKLMSDPAATRAMGEKGRARAMEKFNLNIQSKKLESLILDAAKQAGTIS